jgi:hypothetical protein
MYGGIHYRAAIENGVAQGTNLGNYINKEISFFKSKLNYANQRLIS